MPDIPQQPTPPTPPVPTQPQYSESVPQEGFVSKMESFLSKPVFSIVASIILIGMIMGVLIYNKVFDIQKIFNFNFNGNKTHNSSNIASVEQQVPYQIISQDPKDKVGRTVVYKNRIWVKDKLRTVTEGLGWEFNQEPGSSFKDKYGVTGYYMGFEPVTSSRDRYILVKIPDIDELLKIRLLFQPLSLKYGTASAQLQTNLYVENLDVVVKEKTQGGGPQDGIDRIGLLDKISDSDLKRLFHNNDVVSLTFLQANQSRDLLFDSNDALISDYISIRRFNGYNQIQKEILHSDYR